MKTMILSKIIALSIMICLFATTSSCKKDDTTKPSTATTTTTPPPSTGTQKFNYRWNYKKAGDPLVYQGTGCYTAVDMATIQSANGYYNVQTLGPC